MDVRGEQIEFGNWKDMCYNEMKALRANEICQDIFHLPGTGPVSLNKLRLVSGRKPDWECFPRQTGKLGLWGKAKSIAQVAGFG